MGGGGALHGYQAKIAALCACCPWGRAFSGVTCHPCTVPTPGFGSKALGGGVTGGGAEGSEPQSKLIGLSPEAASAGGLGTPRFCRITQCPLTATAHCPCESGAARMAQQAHSDRGGFAGDCGGAEMLWASGAGCRYNFANIQKAMGCVRSVCFI